MRSSRIPNTYNSFCSKLTQWTYLKLIETHMITIQWPGLIKISIHQLILKIQTEINIRVIEGINHCQNLTTLNSFISKTDSKFRKIYNHRETKDSYNLTKERKLLSKKEWAIIWGNSIKKRLNQLVYEQIKI